MVKIGEVIEENEGENHKTIEFLQSYCDELYEVSLVIAENGEPNFNKLFKRIAIKLKDVLYSIKNDIKVRQEIVFMPYKASMWDALESVWKAADEDPDCDAYVIPIPYYDRKNDFSFGEMHYEGEDFPDYVPITHYNAYNLETRHPDAIYIHNPYDECNYVTSVDPKFYSSELKNYTDCLVYIPYFVLEEPDPNDPLTIKSVGHFATKPGVINAHKVIVQSDAMREVYIKALLEKYGDTPELKKYFESKIFGTGSPKFDKVCNTTKDNIEIPDEWLKVIQKEDGSYKRIFLYNISVTALLQYDEKMLTKIENVLKVFYANRDEVALLWRPHPLMKATIESMQPELWNNYKKIVDKYIEDGWGIYDDTPDLNRAIALSDAYYGDPSSVVQLCQSKSMPVMLQNVGALENNRTRFLSYAQTDDEFWFVEAFSDVLLKYEKKTGITTYVCQLERNNKNEGYREVVCINGKVYIAPIFADEIIVYEIDTAKKYSISLNLTSYKCMPINKYVKFSKLYVYGKFIFAVPMALGAIVRINTETDEIKYFSKFTNALEPYIKNITEFWCTDSCLIGNKLYITSGCANALVEFDLEDCTTNVLKITVEQNGWNRLCYDGNYFWLLNKAERNLVVCDKNGELKKKMQIESKSTFSNLVFCGDYVVHIPYNSDAYCEVFDTTTFERQQVLLQIPENSKYDISANLCNNDVALFGLRSNGNIYLYSTKTDSLCIFDKLGNLTEEIVFELSDVECSKVARAKGQYMSKDANYTECLYNEDYSIKTLLSFIYSVMERKKDTKNFQDINMNGRNIYDVVKGLY